jgi:hypothetical protein
VANAWRPIVVLRVGFYKETEGRLFQKYASTVRTHTYLQLKSPVEDVENPDV